LTSDVLFDIPILLCLIFHTLVTYPLLLRPNLFPYRRSSDLSEQSTESRQSIEESALHRFLYLLTCWNRRLRPQNVLPPYRFPPARKRRPFFRLHPECRYVSD